MDQNQEATFHLPKSVVHSRLLCPSGMMEISSDALSDVLLVCSSEAFPKQPVEWPANWDKWPRLETPHSLRDRHTHLIWVFTQHCLVWCLFQATRIHRMFPENYLFVLPSGHLHLLGIGDDNIVTTIDWDSKRNGVEKMLQQSDPVRDAPPGS